MGAVLRRAKRAAVATGELPRYRVPQHWGRQLGVTLKQQLEHCRLAVRTDVPCPSGTKAFEWRAVV